VRSTNPTERSALRLAVTPLRNVQVRDASGTGDGSWTIEGYAAVYEQETTLYDIPGWVRVREEIARGAFTDVLDGVKHGRRARPPQPRPRHEDRRRRDRRRRDRRPRAREDFHGERFFARVDPEDPDARALAVKMRRGVVRQASFAFTIGDEELVEENELDDGTLD
jgi:HK97 family phage prohead protease